MGIIEFGTFFASCGAARFEFFFVGVGVLFLVLFGVCGRGVTQPGATATQIWTRVRVIYRSIDLAIYLSIYPSIYRSINLSIDPSICGSIDPSMVFHCN